MPAERERPPEASPAPTALDQPADGSGWPRRPGSVAEQPAEPVRRKSGRRWFWIFAALLATVAAYFELRPGAKPVSSRPAIPPAAISAEQARAGEMNVYIVALGTVTPVYTVTVFTQVTGRLIGVYYRQGQMVRQGDPLVDIDPRPYQAQVAQAQGTLEHDRSLLAQARTDLERYRAALAGHAIAAQTVDDQAQLVAQYAANVKSDEGTVAYNETQLSYCHIVSPITGRVGLRLVDPGNVVFAGNSATLLVITQMQPITVVFSVSEDDLPAIQTQLRGGHTLRVDAFDRSYTNLLAAGSLGSLNNEIDTTTGTVKFRANFTNANLALFPNQFVNARLLLRTLHKVTLVPSAAVQYNGTSAFVYIVEPNHTVTVQPVTVLNSNERDTAITGVNPGVTVATSGFDRLENGVTVLLRNAAPPHRKTPGPGSRAIGKTFPGKGGK